MKDVKAFHIDEISKSGERRFGGRFRDDMRLGDLHLLNQRTGFFGQMQQVRIALNHVAPCAQA